jgi:hypothetical protein
MVLKGGKSSLWSQPRRKFVSPEVLNDLVKEYSMRQLAISFHNWRSKLNTNFVKKGLHATKMYDKITEAQ